MTIQLSDNGVYYKHVYSLVAFCKALCNAAKALIVLAMGIIVNFLVVTGIFMIPCILTPVDTEEEEAPQPAFGNLTTCDEVRSLGFIILVDVFAAVLIASELAKHIANSTKHNLFYRSIHFVFE
jgi:cytochrome b subunit of formate dehydrogenase